MEVEPSYCSKCQAAMLDFFLLFLFMFGDYFLIYTKTSENNLWVQNENITVLGFITFAWAKQSNRQKIQIHICQILKFWNKNYVGLNNYQWWNPVRINKANIYKYI